MRDSFTKMQRKIASYAFSKNAGADLSPSPSVLYVWKRPGRSFNAHILNICILFFLFIYVFFWIVPLFIHLCLSLSFSDVCAGEPCRGFTLVPSAIWTPRTMTKEKRKAWPFWSKETKSMYFYCFFPLGKKVYWCIKKAFKFSAEWICPLLFFSLSRDVVPFLLMPFSVFCKASLFPVILYATLL